jgi:putative transposase
MPSKHLIRHFETPAFYHVYNRGAGKQPIFHDSADKRKFLSLFERHLLEGDDDTALYPRYDVELVAYCLMGNHFHLLLYQDVDRWAISNLMKSVATAYTMYFNRRYKSSGHLFQGPFRASHIADDAYLAHISRYIHLNPRTYRSYYWSSLKYYLGEATSELIHPERVLDVTPTRYLEFLEDYTDRHNLLQAIRDELAL